MEENRHTYVYQLIDEIRSGNQRAFQDFVEIYQRLVGHIVFRMIPNTSDREDLCQDVFLRVYKNLDTFRFQCKMSTWIAKIAYNTCLNYLQKKRPVLYKDLAHGTMSLEDIDGNGHSPDMAAVEEDTSLRIHAELERLPVHYRTLLTLYHLDEMSYYEIGRIMDLPEGTVKNYLFRARKKLKELLVSKYKVDELWEAAT
jgi:RNA polymerase sigma factor (sigma-70 family)